MTRFEKHYNSDASRDSMRGAVCTTIVQASASAELRIRTDEHMRKHPNHSMEVIATRGEDSDWYIVLLLWVEWNEAFDPRSALKEMVDFGERTFLTRVRCDV